MRATWLHRGVFVLLNHQAVLLLHAVGQDRLLQRRSARPVVPAAADDRHRNKHCRAGDGAKEAVQAGPVPPGVGHRRGVLNPAPAPESPVAFGVMHSQSSSQSAKSSKWVLPDSGMKLITRLAVRTAGLVWFPVRASPACWCSSSGLRPSGIASSSSRACLLRFAYGCPEEF